MKVRELIRYLQFLETRDAVENPNGPDLEIHPPDMHLYSGDRPYAEVGKGGTYLLPDRPRVVIESPDT